MVNTRGFRPAPTITRAASQASPAIVSSRPTALPGRRAHPKRPATTKSTPTVLVGLTYVVCGAHLVLVCRGGRPVYDRLAHTIVRAALGQRCQDGY